MKKIRLGFWLLLFVGGIHVVVQIYQNWYDNRNEQQMNDVWSIRDFFEMNYPNTTNIHDSTALKAIYQRKVTDRAIWVLLEIQNSSLSEQERKKFRTRLLKDFNGFHTSEQDYYSDFGKNSMAIIDEVRRKDSTSKWPSFIFRYKNYFLIPAYIIIFLIIRKGFFENGATFLNRKEYE